MKTEQISEPQICVKICPVCQTRLTIAELSNYLHDDKWKRIRCFDCKSWSRFTKPRWRRLIAYLILMLPLLLIALIPFLLAIVSWLEYWGGVRSGRAVGIVFIIVAWPAITFVLWRYTAKFLHFLSYHLEPVT